MAKGQRGNAAPSTKTADMDPRTEGFSLMLASSDDEAPDEMTFEDSKAEALRSMKEALLAARREKELLKEKRRKRQQLFQEQKVCVFVETLVFKLQTGFCCFSLKGKYTVTTVKERAAAASQQQAAEDFLQSRLYGPGSCRTTSKTGSVMLYTGYCFHSNGIIKMALVVERNQF
uniref:Nucleolar protein 7 n=1 Tax=Cyclopterus lumpus TaxID=8103 RepID=A0A8C2ZTW4_CYCLU